MTTTHPSRWTSAATTHVGHVRTHNEDALLNLPERGLWAVADGMGGHAAGEYASRLIVKALAELPTADTLDSYRTAASQCLGQVNRQLRDEARRRREPVIGSTVVALLAHGDQGLLVWAGDSRAYRYRRGAIERLTRDHSRVEEMIDLGLITREQSAAHPAANIITRAIGVGDDLELEFAVTDTEEGDVFLLCSDGLYREVAEPEMARILGGGDEQRACELLLERTLSRRARDNVSIVVVQVPDAITQTKTQWNPSVPNDSKPTLDSDDPTERQ